MLLRFPSSFGSTALRLVSVGIALLKLTEESSKFSVPHLICWLLGRHDNVKLGLYTSMKLSDGLAASWAAYSMVPRLGSQLVELESCETSSIWQVLFQLQSLRHLRLSVVSQDASPPDEPPADRKLPQLRNVWLTKCTASVSPLLVGTALPQLTKLAFESCNWAVPMSIPE